MSKKEGKKIECFMCGACCIAYDISSLKKAAGERCIHLTLDNKCGDYENRPEVCKSLKADRLCVFISTLTDEERVIILKAVYID